MLDDYFHAAHVGDFGDGVIVDDAGAKTGVEEDVVTRRSGGKGLRRGRAHELVLNIVGGRGTLNREWQHNLWERLRRQKN